MLRFRDPHRDLIQQAGLEIGATVRVLAAPQGKEASELLIEGELTGLEAEFDASGSHVVARGYDRSHRLHRGRWTETYRDVTDSDIVRTVAQRAGIEVGSIDETSTVHRHVSQANVSDWEFLTWRAREIGYEIAMVGGKLEFRPPVQAGDGPQEGDLASADPLQLVLGADLDSFRPRVTSAEQVSEVTVTGWDAGRKEALTGRAQAETVSASLSLKPADLAASIRRPDLCRRRSAALHAGRGGRRRQGGCRADRELVCRGGGDRQGEPEAQRGCRRQRRPDRRTLRGPLHHHLVPARVRPRRVQDPLLRLRPPGPIRCWPLPPPAGRTAQRCVRSRRSSASSLGW